MTANWVSSRHGSRPCTPRMVSLAVGTLLLLSCCVATMTSRATAQQFPGGSFTAHAFGAPPAPAAVCTTAEPSTNAMPDGSCCYEQQSCAPQTVTGVDSAQCQRCREPDWTSRAVIPWQALAQGEYVGPPRSRHVDVYPLRVDDELEFVYRLTREQTSEPYELTPGDEIRVESLTAEDELDRNVTVQPDGTITLPYVRQVQAAGRTTEELRQDLNERFKEYLRDPSITVTPLLVNTRLEDLRAVVDSRQGVGGQSRTAVVTPDGTVQLPAIGSVPAHGLTLDELKVEIDARYGTIVKGIEVTPVLTQRAPRFIYVLGEVQQPGRVDMVGPTTVMQAISLAGGWNTGANLRQIVVFRRAEDWRLLATRIDLRGGLYGKRPAPADEIFLRDSDIVLVPKSPILVLDDAIEMIFTRGIYSAAPFLTDGIFFRSDSRL